MIEFILLIFIVALVVFNLGAIMACGTYGLNHFHESFTWEGCSRAYYNVNPVGIVILLILAYVFLAPCAIIYWIARLFTY